MGEQYKPVRTESLSGTIKLKNAKEFQQLLEKALNLNKQLKETLQQIEQFKLEA